MAIDGGKQLESAASFFLSDKHIARFVSGTDFSLCSECRTGALGQICVLAK